jgi:hypothetical protein
MQNMKRSVTMVHYLFRKPVFPVICEIDGFVFADNSSKSLEKWLQTIPLGVKTTYDMVDATAEGWSFMPEHMAVSPLTFKKNWTKKAVIALYNGRKNMPEPDRKYSEKSLSSKRFDQIFSEIVELLATTRVDRLKAEGS